MLDSKARKVFGGLANGVGTTLGRMGVTADAVTTLGLVLTGIAAWAVATGRPVLGGWILVVGSILDFVDGAIARATGSTRPFGAFLDSVSDRVSDAAITGAIAYAAFTGTVEWPTFAEPWANYVGANAIILLGLSMLVSYQRAKAESLGFTAHVGIAERAERLIALMFGLVFGWVGWIVPVLAAVTGFTAVQRFVHVARQARGT